MVKKQAVTIHISKEILNYIEGRCAVTGNSRSSEIEMLIKAGSANIEIQEQLAKEIKKEQEAIKELLKFDIKISTKNNALAQKNLQRISGLDEEEIRKIERESLTAFKNSFAKN